MIEALDAGILMEEGGWKPQFLGLREAEAGSPTSWVLPGKGGVGGSDSRVLRWLRGWGLGLLVQKKLQVSPVALGAFRLGPSTQVKCKGKLCPIVSQVIPDYVKTETGGAWRGKEGSES